MGNQAAREIQEATPEQRTAQLRATRDGLMLQKRELERKIGELQDRQEKEKRRKEQAVVWTSG